MQENDHHNPTVSQYFSKIQVNEQSKPFLNKKHDQKTPEKGILQNAQCNSPPSGLLSPDDLMLPTPPQPKRLKMDETDKSFARNLKNPTKLHPRSLISSAPAKSSLTSQPVENQVSKFKNLEAIEKDTRNPDSNLDNKGRICRKKMDFYSLGRHKVLECLDTGNQQEKCFIVQPEDDSISVKRHCMLRDFW